ncbi:MAG: biotin/lipoyl-binding protein [Prevotella sp.]|nr:biotin/lipoyl-binding protein [Prevotella sp.]
MKEYKYTIDGKEYVVAIGDIVENMATVTVNGEDYQVEMEPEKEPEKKKVVLGQPAAETGDDESAAATNVNTQNAVKAPLPGVITDIKVSVGQEVKKGDVVIVLEAMKMANNLEAERDGKVTAICVKMGENVMEDAPLVVIE